MTLFENNPETKTVKVTQEESPKFTLTPEDFKRMSARFLVYILAAAVTFLADNLKLIDFGQYTPVVVPVIGFLIDSIRRFLTEQKYLVK